MWLEMMKNFSGFGQQKGKKTSEAYEEYQKKQLDLLTAQKSLYLDMLHQTKEHTVNGDLSNLILHCQNYIAESTNLMQKGLGNHLDFYKTSPLALSSIAETYGNFFQDLFGKMNHQSQNDKKTQKTSNKNLFAPSAFAAVLSPFFFMSSTKAMDVMRPIENAFYGSQAENQPVVDRDFFKTQTEFQTQLVDFVTHQILQLFRQFKKQEQLSETKSFSESEFLDFQQALLDSFAVLKDGEDEPKSAFEKALRDGKKKLRHVPEEKKNVYFKFLESHKDEILSIVQQLRRVPEEEKNLYAKSLSAQLALTDKMVSPNLTVAYIDTLKEIKNKFSKSNESSSGKKITSLNEISQDVAKTATGSYLKYAFPGQDMEYSLAEAVNLLLRKIKGDQYKKNRIASETLIDALNNRFDDTRREVINLCREIIINEALNKDAYVFYHGHGNSLRLYMDMLREIKSYEVIGNLDRTNPLRDKSAESPIKSVDDILDQYEEASLDFAARNNLKLFDDNRTLGVGFAPDKIELFRDHAISVNINLFGNLDTLAECTFFYFLDSFNISDPNENLLKNIITRISAPDTPTEEIQKKVNRYKKLYMKNMSRTGGNLMQIFVKKEAVDQIGFASWMKGIPIWMEKETQKIATRGGNDKAVPILTNKDEKYQRPQLSDYVGLFRTSPDDFINKYSNFDGKSKVTKRNKIHSFDRPQARLIIDPEMFSDPNYITVNQYTRFSSATEDFMNYQSDLKRYIAKDISDYLKELQSETIERPDGDRLGKLLRLMKQGQEFEAQQQKLSEV